MSPFQFCCMIPTCYTIFTIIKDTHAAITVQLLEKLVLSSPVLVFIELENAQRINSRGKKTDVENTHSVTAHARIHRCIILIVFMEIIAHGWKPVSILNFVDIIIQLT